MRKATRIVAAVFGFLAGIAGLAHGATEILQGNIRPTSFMFASIGTPCVPEKVWHACEPAMTLLPNLLAAGFLTVILGLMIMVWSAAFVQHKNGGVILILLSVFLLLVGGGFFPPLIGIAGGIAGTRINKPLTGKTAGSLLRFAAKLWPWPLVIFVAWLLGQYLVGYFFNDFLKSIMGFALLLILVSLPLSIYTGYAQDKVAHAGKEPHLDMFSKFLTPGILFILTLVFGVWLSLSGKPYNGILFNIHKLIALGVVVVTVVQLYQMLKGTQIQVSPIVLFVIAGLCVVALFFTGAMMSAGKLDYQVMLAIHRIALILISIVMVVTVYLLAGRKL